jgi:hypothetical protein
MSDCRGSRRRLLGRSVALATMLTAGIVTIASASRSPAASAATDQKPKIESQPSVSGTPQQGQTLTANNGTWSGAKPISFGYQWQRCDSSGCHEIYGANKPTYTLTADDVDNRMRVKVTAKNDVGSTLAISERTPRVTAAPARAPQNTSPPAVSGTPQEGQRLSGKRGDWSNNPTDFNYFWTRCDKSGGSCSNIGGANGATADVGRCRQHPAVQGAGLERGRQHVRLVRPDRGNHRRRVAASAARSGSERLPGRERTINVNDCRSRPSSRPARTAGRSSACAGSPGSRSARTSS